MSEIDGAPKSPERKTIDGAALTPFEHLAMGSGVDFTKLDGTKVRITQNGLLQLFEEGKGFVNEDYFVPLGVLNGTLSVEEALAERDKFPIIEELFAVGLFEPEGTGDLIFDEGFKPQLHLPRLNLRDNSRIGADPTELKLTFPNKRAGVGLTEKDIAKLKLNEGMDRLFLFEPPTVENPIGTISVRPEAMTKV